MSKKLLLFIIFLGLAATALYLGVNKFRPNNQLPRVSIPNPLANINTPVAPTLYPAEWPEDLKYPKAFVPVDTASGSLTEGAPTAYSAKLRYKGTPPQALTLMTKFLMQKSWEVTDQIPLNSGGATIILQRGQGSGIIVFDFDPEDPSQTLVTATIFSKK